MSNNRPLVIGLIAAVALCLCLACALAVFGAYFLLAPQGPITGPTTGEFSGYYTNGFEVSAFVPCDEPAEQWWLSSDPALNFYDQYQALVTPVLPPSGGYVPVFLRFVGTVSPPGSYGHLGAYTREATVEEVIEMSLDGTCE